MKILYVSSERGAAQIAAQALHGIAPDVRLTWTGSLSPALRWVQDNRDVAAVVLETDGQHQSSASFVEHVRGLGLTAPVVIVVPEHGGAPLLELKAGADDYVVNNQSLVADLPRVLTRALERTLAGPHPTKAPLRLLYVGDATLARKYLENPHWSIAITEAIPEADGTLPALSLAFDVVLVEYDHPGVNAFATLKDIAGRRLHIPVILVVEWDEKAAIPAFKLGAVDYVVKAADSLRALFFKLDRVPAASALTERAELNLEVVDGRERLERQLRDALATASDTERCFNTAAEHFRQSQTRLQATIDQERAGREMLEARLAEVEASHQAARRLALDEMAAAVAEPVTRQGEDATALEAATRAALDERVAELEAELERAGTRRALEATAAAEQLARVGAEFKVGLTNAFRARDDLKHQLHESTAALEASRHHRKTESAAAAEHLSRREAEAAATAAVAAAARTALERELAQAAVALDQAKERAAVERAALAQEAATRQEELANRLAEEAARRSTVEQNLANAETARQHAEQWAASELAAAEARLADDRAQQDAALARADSVRAALEQQLLERDRALEQAEERRRSEAAASASQMAERHEEFTVSLAQATRSHDALVQQLRETAGALEEARQNRTAEAAAAADHLTRREAEFAATLAEAVAVHTALEQKLTQADEALQQAETRAANERATALQEAATRRTEFEERLARDAAKRSMLEEHLATAETARKDAEERHASEVATAESRVADRQGQYDAAMARAAQVRAALDQKLLELEAALRQADERHRLETMAFADRLSHRESELTASVEDVTRARDELAERLGVVAAALEASERDRASEAAAAADRCAQLGAGLSEAAAARRTLERTLADIETAHQHSRQRVAAELATTAERQVELEHQLARETARRTTLEQKLAHAQTAQQGADERHATELAAAASHVAGVQAQYDAAVADAARTRAVFEQQLREAAAALEGARQVRASEAAAAADHLVQREADLGITLAEAMTARSALEQQLADVEATHQQAQQRVAGELAAAAERRADLEQQLAQETAGRTTLEQNLAHARIAQENTDERHAMELAAAASHVAGVQAQYDAAVADAARTRAVFEQQLREAAAALEGARQVRASEAAAAADHLAQREAELAGVQAQYDAAVADAARTRDVFEQQLREAAAALEGARQVRASEAAAAADHLAQREAELGATLAEAMTARGALEQTLADVEAAHQQAEQRVAGELAAAAERQAAIEANLHLEATSRHALEGDLAEMRLESTHGRRRFLDVISTIRRRSREHRGRLEAQLTREQAERNERFAAKQEEIRLIGLERESLQQSLGAAEDEIRRLHKTRTEEHATYERARLASEAGFRRLSAEYDHVREALDQVRAAFDTLELASSQQVSECARLEHVVAERDSQLSAQAASHFATAQAAETALAQAQERLRLALEASSRDIAQLEHERDALRQELDVTTAHREALRSDAERMPVLQRQLDESQTEYRTQFERAPYGMCRFNSDGEITHVNRSLVRVLGYRTADELRQVDFATTVFESADDMRWLIERCLSTGTTEPVETTWRNKDRGRVVVRLRAAPAANGSIELIAEDITSLRAVEDQLRRAQRMEAVGRLASEVAVTCDHLLRDVTQGGEQWLAAVGTDPVLRHQGEHLLGEVTRAASFLRQLGVYGHTQVSALEPVTVGRVLRDLEGVLKRVAGDDIELILPGTSPSVEVDVDAERVERVLVNVASYARERMPHGGRLKIELSTVTVDSRFIAKYPNVRPGAHLLITVTEIPSTVRASSPIGLASEPAAAEAERARSERPGVDLGALLGLIGDCGGHVWMAAEPPGNMVLKIHLPTRISAEPADQHAPVTLAGRAQSMARWFRH